MSSRCVTLLSASWLRKPQPVSMMNAASVAATGSYTRVKTIFMSYYFLHIPFCS
jgi:hypothetical protein